jgi:hypothetical protein
MSVTAAFAALGDFVSHIANLVSWNGNLTHDEALQLIRSVDGFNIDIEGIHVQWVDYSDKHWLNREEIKQDYLYTAECWLYRDLPERSTCFPDKMLIYLLMNNYRRVFLCGSHENNCSQEFYDNAYGYKSDVAFITGHFKNGLHFLSKGYDEGLSDYHCPGCGAKIEGGQEIYLQFNRSL